MCEFKVVQSQLLISVEIFGKFKISQDFVKMCLYYPDFYRNIHGKLEATCIFTDLGGRDQHFRYSLSWALLFGELLVLF